MFLTNGIHYLKIIKALEDHNLVYLFNKYLSFLYGIDKIKKYKILPIYSKRVKNFCIIY
jgi:hypothetical protein